MTETPEPVPSVKLTGNLITGKDGGAVLIGAGDSITVTGSTFVTRPIPKTNENGPIKAGTRVRLIHPPGTGFPYDAVGVAQEAPGDSGLFLVQFPQARMHTRVSEVEIAGPGE